MMEFANNSGINFEQEVVKRKMEFEKMKHAWAMEGKPLINSDQALMSQGVNM
jgi:hypothetical protein